MTPEPAHYCPICNARVQLDADGAIAEHDDVSQPELAAFEHCDGTGGEPVVCAHADACPDDCPGVLEAAAWHPVAEALSGGPAHLRTYRGLQLVVRLPPSWPSWAAYQDADQRVYVNGGQAAGLRDAERRALTAVDVDFRDTAPPCLVLLRCHQRRFA